MDITSSAPLKLAEAIISEYGLTGRAKKSTNSSLGLTVSENSAHSEDSETVPPFTIDGNATEAIFFEVFIISLNVKFPSILLLTKSDSSV